MKQKLFKICAAPGCNNEFKLYRTTDKFCCPNCKRENTKQKPKAAYKKINPYSEKRGAQLRQYSKDRKVYLAKPENKYCFVKGCGKLANTIEHTAGRANDMLLNQEFFKPCCLEHNLEFENNSELSKEYQLSRLTKKKKI